MTISDFEWRRNRRWAESVTFEEVTLQEKNLFCTNSDKWHLVYGTPVNSPLGNENIHIVAVIIDLPDGNTQLILDNTGIKSGVSCYETIKVPDALIITTVYRAEGEYHAFGKAVCYRKGLTMESPYYYFKDSFVSASEGITQFQGLDYMIGSLDVEKLVFGMSIIDPNYLKNKNIF